MQSLPMFERFPIARRGIEAQRSRLTHRIEHNRDGLWKSEQSLSQIGQGTPICIRYQKV